MVNELPDDIKSVKNSFPDGRYVLFVSDDNERIISS